jgi:hypothetical protein
VKKDEVPREGALSPTQTSSAVGSVKGTTYNNFKWPEGAMACLLRDFERASSIGVWESHCYGVLWAKAFRAYSARVSLYRGNFLTTGCKEHKISDALKNLELEGLLTKTYTQNDKGHMAGPIIFTVRALSGGNSIVHEVHNGNEPLCMESASSVHTSEEVRIRKEREAPRRPTLDDWLAYAQEIKWDKHDACGAFDYYESIGWMQSENRPVVNWRACAKRCSKKAQKTPVVGLSKPKAKIKGIYDGCESSPAYRRLGYESMTRWKEAGCPYD